MTTSVQIIGTGYMETVSGKCKIIAMISSAIACPLVRLGFTGRLIEIFQVAAITSSIVSFVLLVLYMSTLVKRVPIAWNKYQMFFYFLWTLFYMFACISVLYYGRRYVKLIAGGIFGLISTLSHTIDCIDNYKKLYRPKNNCFGRGLDIR